MTIRSPLGVVLLASLSCSAILRAEPLGDRPGEIIGRFSESGDRAQFLKELHEAVASKAYGFYGGSYEAELKSLISALEQETPPPPAELKPEKERTPEESIQAWVYELRYATQEYWAPANAPPDARKKLEAMGPAAMDALVAALDDDAPSQEIGFEEGPSLAVLLRRSDLALECIEYISAIHFFSRSQGRGGQFHNDSQRRSVRANIRAWWTQAKGKSQADGLRVQVALWAANRSLNGHNSNGHWDASVYGAAWPLITLLALEPPQPALDQLRALSASDTWGLNSSITAALLETDPQSVLREAFARNAEGHPRDGDDAILLVYGGKRVYQQLSHRALVEHVYDPGWNEGDVLRSAALYGKGWAIPFVAAMLTGAAMTDIPRQGPTLEREEAGIATGLLQTLTGKEFGYREEAPKAQRLAAVQKAHDWWVSAGEAEMAQVINADHPTATTGTDLLASEEEISAVVARLSSPDPTIARAAVASLEKVFAFRTREALLARLAKETDLAQRGLILEKLEHAGRWQAPALADIFEKEGPVEVRVAAARALLHALDYNIGGTFLFRSRLESRDAALASIRRAVDKGLPPELVLPAWRLLSQERAFVDEARIKLLAAREPARSDPEVQRSLVQ